MHYFGGSVKDFLHLEKLVGSRAPDSKNGSSLKTIDFLIGKDLKEAVIWPPVQYLTLSLAPVISDLSWATFSKQKSLPPKDLDSPASLCLPSTLPFKSSVLQVELYILIWLGSHPSNPSFGAE